MHLDENRIQRFLHGEMSSEELGPTQAHLASCPVCSTLLENAQREEEVLFGLLAHLDHPVPSLDPAQVFEASEPTRPRRMRWAAGIIGVLGISTAAYAAPGSPIPDWILGPSGEGRPEPIPTLVSPAGPSGISVPPGSELVVVFSPTVGTGSVRVSIEEIEEVVVESRAGNPVFTSDLDRLLVEQGENPGEFLVRIPTSAPRVEIRLGDQLLFVKVGTTVTSDAPLDDQGRFVFSLGGEEPVS